MARCGFNSQFYPDAAYCIDAPRLLPAGSTERFDPKRDDHFEPFAAPSAAFRY